MDKDWKEKVQEYCEKYNIPLVYLAETMYEPKVVPMIRGKAFEFTIFMLLQKVLNQDEWEVTKPSMNAQTGFHDIDVRVTHKKTKKDILIECKLAKKGGYQKFADGHSEIRVKCMRSRTLGIAKVKELAPKWGVSKKMLTIHNDQYLPGDFDIVVSSIGNAFYRTHKTTGIFEWNPTKSEQEFLLKLNPSNKNNLKDFSFRNIYIARTESLAVTHDSGVVCTRRNCQNKTNCGFVPNYPIIYFDAKTNNPTNGWVPIEESLNIFKGFVGK